MWYLNYTVDLIIWVFNMSRPATIFSSQLASIMLSNNASFGWTTLSNVKIFLTSLEMAKKSINTCMEMNHCRCPMQECYADNNGQMDRRMIRQWPLGCPWLGHTKASITKLSTGQNACIHMDAALSAQTQACACTDAGVCPRKRSRICVDATLSAQT